MSWGNLGRGNMARVSIAVRKRKWYVLKQPILKRRKECCRIWNGGAAGAAENADIVPSAAKYQAPTSHQRPQAVSAVMMTLLSVDLPEKISEKKRGEISQAASGIMKKKMKARSEKHKYKQARDVLIKASKACISSRSKSKSEMKRRRKSIICSKKKIVYLLH